MHRIATLLASVPNPGPHTPPDSPVLPALGDNLWGICLGIIGVIVGVIVALTAVANSKGRRILPITGVAFGVTILLAGGYWCVHSNNAIVRARDAADQAANDYEVGYNESVKRWLSGEYGITANDGSVNTLIRGGQLVASTKVGQKMIQLATTTDDKLAVQVVGGDILQPADIDR